MGHFCSYFSIFFKNLWDTVFTYISFFFPYFKVDVQLFFYLEKVCNQKKRK